MSVCPNGHQSATDDFCDTCGAPNDLCLPGTKCTNGLCEAASQGVMTMLCGA